MDLVTVYAVDQNILWLYIPMRYLPIVHVIQSIEKLFCYGDNFLLAHWTESGFTSLHDIIIKFTISDELRYDKIKLFVIKDFVNAHYVWMREFFKDL